MDVRTGAFYFFNLEFYFHLFSRALPVIMTKRPNPFKKFIPPKNKEVETDQEEDQSTNTPSATNATETASANASTSSSSSLVPPVVLSSVNLDPDSDGEAEIPPVNNQQPTGSLVVSNESFALLNGFVTRLTPLARRRAQLTQAHESLAGRLKAGGIPHLCRINDQAPAPPPGINYTDQFYSAYRTKANQYSRRLSHLILREYRAQIEELTRQINDIVEEGEATLINITDEEDRKRSINLFRVKVQAVFRRADNSIPSNRRYAKPKRKLQKK